VSISPVEELRWLEYGQRLQARQRNIGVMADSPSVGETLLRHALQGGIAASGLPAAGVDAADELLLAAQSDRIELDAAHPLLAACTAADVIDTWVFSGNRPLVKTVIAGGRLRVEEGRHASRDTVSARFARSMRQLLG
jgi:formimidoylglutamate deiminase